MTRRRIVLDDRPPRTQVPVLDSPTYAFATLDETRTYRYTLTREWRVGGTRCCFIMLNPSTADERKDDPTIRRCIGFAKAWGYDALDVVNLFALRATSPNVLRATNPPEAAIGPSNDNFIIATAHRAALVVAAWGIYGSYLRRDLVVRSLLKRERITVHHLGLTGSAADERAGIGDVMRQPRHPLYLRRDVVPLEWF